MNDFLGKPLDVIELSTAIGRWLRPAVYGNNLPVPPYTVLHP